MNTGINESTTLTKHISCKCKCKFGGKNIIYTKKIIFGILVYVDAKMENI